MTMKQMKKSGGFTLIEIMVVMVILGLLVAIVAPNILGRSDQARVTVAQTQMSNIANALDLYRLDNGHYPSTQQGLQALVSKPSGSPEPRNWNPDGYLKSVPQDPWDNDYQYISPGVNGPYDLYSYGADGREGGDEDAADISVWDDPNQ
ncbi:type II secretion system protein GspG [Marinobacter nanhaiticus D15-8W]|uniref:Type II secretion system core protein G n=2 Tax=Marinobacter TaxID=2742 RepID=N6WQR1_9GAMM|nr:type II secretion system major pseudopilin GspG [Marinobacter nanhaiticus]ENO13921.2 type II secretion system protein GspG [Marinobacter nanhaiticus D15-8W]